MQCGNKNSFEVGRIIAIMRFADWVLVKSLPAFVDCQKDSESTGKNGTQVKPVLLAVEIFAVQCKDGSNG